MHTPFAPCAGNLLTRQPWEERPDVTPPITSCPDDVTPMEGQSTVIYNSRITVSGIPDEAHEYMLGSRSGVEWVMERYQVKVDKASQIKNDPDDWSREVEDPRYILDLLARVVRVSVETVGIVRGLPGLVI